jgi:hypothetical protein
MAEPEVAVARDHVIDRVPHHPWDEVKDPCPLPAWRLARRPLAGNGTLEAALQACARDALDRRTLALATNRWSTRNSANSSCV